MSTVVNSSDVLRVWPHLQTPDGRTLMLQPGESAEVELPDGFADPYLEVDGAPTVTEQPAVDPPAASQPSQATEKPPVPDPTETSVSVVIDADGEGRETIPHPPATVSIVTQPKSGTASLEPAEGHPEDTCVKVVNATPASTQTVELHITTS